METNSFFRPGREWLDTDGNPIAAHGGGIMIHEGVYYWYGEARLKFYEFPGLTCYSSRDLLNWKSEGYVLEPSDDDAHDLFKTHAIERPKVIFNKKTKKFVMWMHVENDTYSWARSGVAISDRATGPFTYLKSIRPNGQEARDMTLFQDDDGTAYLVHASDMNATTNINRLTDDYLDVDGVWTKAFEYRFREAPAFFKHEDRYYSISSNTTGFSPNASEYAVADNFMGPWKIMGDPCAGYGSESSFHCQSTFCIPVKSDHCKFILLCDHWYTQELGKSWYPWLPIDIDAKGRLSLQWYDAWNLQERQISDGYRETPQGPELKVGRGKVDVTIKPDGLLVPVDKENKLRALSWIRWESGEYHLALWVHDISENIVPNGGGRVADIFLGYHDICLYGDGRVQKTTDFGYGCKGRTQRRQNLSEEYELTASRCDQVENQHSNLVGLSPDAKGTLYVIRVGQGFAKMRPIEAGAEIAYSVALYDAVEHAGENPNNCVRQTATPKGWRWMNTDTYYKGKLV